MTHRDIKHSDSTSKPDLSSPHDALGRRRFLVGALGAIGATVIGSAYGRPRTTPGTAAGAATTPTAGTAPLIDGRKLKVFGAYATAIEEPWDGVIHTALQDHGVDYTFNDKLGYSGDMERVLREVCEQDHPDIIFGDAFGNEDPVRAVARDYPDIAFVFGSGGGPAEPNFSVFDNWIHEPAYLAGMLAGGITKTNVLGVVGGMPVPEVNRIVNAFIAGAQKQNPAVEVKVTFINSWFDPAAAKEAALAQVDAKADVLFAERAGVIEAAQEKGLVAIGNMSDQSAIAPDTVLTSCVWSMVPTVDYVLKQVAGGTYSAQDLKDFSMMGKGGASLAPVNDKLATPELIKAVTDTEASIRSGSFRVDISEGQPAGSTVNEAPAA